MLRIDVSPQLIDEALVHGPVTVGIGGTTSLRRRLRSEARPALGARAEARALAGAGLILVEADFTHGQSVVHSAVAVVVYAVTHLGGRGGGVTTGPTDRRVTDLLTKTASIHLLVRANADATLSLLLRTTATERKIRYALGGLERGAVGGRRATLAARGAGSLCTTIHTANAPLWTRDTPAAKAMVIAKAWLAQTAFVRGADALAVGPEVLHEVIAAHGPRHVVAVLVLRTRAAAQEPTGRRDTKSADTVRVCATGATVFRQGGRPCARVVGTWPGKLTISHLGPDRGVSTRYRAIYPRERHRRRVHGRVRLGRRWGLGATTQKECSQ